MGSDMTEKKIKEIEQESEKKIFFSGKVYVDRLMKAIEDNRILAFITLAQIIIIFMLILGYIALSKKIVVRVDLPPKLYTDGKIGVGMYSANDLYYKVWGKYVINELANYDPHTIDTKVKEIEYLLEPDFFTKGSQKLLELARYVKENMVRHEFLPIRYTLTEDNVFIAEGVGKSIIGDNLSVMYEKCTYKVKFSVTDYRIFINNLSIECTKIPKADYAYMKREHRILENQKKFNAKDIQKNKDSK